MIKKSAFFVPFLLHRHTVLCAGSFGDALLAIVGDEVITALMSKCAPPTVKKDSSRSSAAMTPSPCYRIAQTNLVKMIDRELVYLDFKRIEANIPQTFYNLALMKSSRIPPAAISNNLKNVSSPKASA
jgi:hypothetical protein